MHDLPSRTAAALTVLLVFAGVVSGLLLVEVISRLTYAEPWYELLAAEQLRSEQRPYRLNNLGFRDRDYSVVKPPDVRRVLVFGDSFTFGAGVEEEAVFPEILERRLNEELKLPSAHRIEVLNGGMYGGVTRNWLERWPMVRRDFDPDLVLIVFFLRDGTRLGSKAHFFDPIRRNIVERNQRSALYRYFLSYRLIRDRLDRELISERYASRLRDAYLGDDRQTAPWRSAQTNLRRLVALIRTRPTSVGFVIFPVLVELNETYPFQEICDLLESFAAELGVRSHSLLPAFLGLNASELWVSPLDQHPNEVAHGIAADSLLPFVVDLLERHEDVLSQAR